MRSERRTAACLLMLVLLLAAAAHACIIVPPPPPYPPPPHPRPIPPRFDLETRSHRAEIEIRHNHALVKVEAVFYNPGHTRLEGEYLFPIEPDILVSSFSMTANGKTLEGELLPADEARRIYEETVRRMKDPGLLEYMGERLIRTRVYPIEPRSEVTIELIYEQLLHGDEGAYHLHYPLRSAKPLGSVKTIQRVVVTIDVEGDAPIASAYCPTYEFDISRKSKTHMVASFEQHSLNPGAEVDFYYMLDKGPVGLTMLTYHPPGDEAGYFYLTLSPSTTPATTKVIPKDLLLVLDTSGSMAGAKIEQAKDALKFCLRSLNPDDRYNVVTFSTTVNALHKGLVPVESDVLAGDLDRVERVKARGGTALHDALGFALEHIPGKGRLGMVLLLTDGLPTIGNTDVPSILSMVEEENAKKMRFFVFGVGDDLNTDLLDGLAARTKGTRTYVAESEDIEVKVSSLYYKIASPVLADLALDLGTAEAFNIYPVPLPDLFAGEDLVVLGRYRQDGATALVLRGHAGTKRSKETHDVTFGPDSQNNFIPRMWAGVKIIHLLEQIRLNGAEDELVDAVKELGQRYGIVTPYTSLLVLEDEIAPEIARRFDGARHSLEKAKVGAGAVRESRRMATMRQMSPAPSSRAMDFTPMAVFGETSDELEQYHSAIRRTVQHVHDRTFYVDEDGVWVDSRYDPSLHGATPEKIVFLSDEYFSLVQSHPEAAKYLSAHGTMLLLLGNDAFHIIEG